MSETLYTDITGKALYNQFTNTLDKQTVKLAGRIQRGEGNLQHILLVLDSTKAKELFSGMQFLSSGKLPIPADKQAQIQKISRGIVEFRINGPPNY